MAGTTKRRSRPSGERREVHKPVDNEWEKEDEELDLEAQLFGRSKKRAKAGPSKVKSVKQDQDAGSDQDMDDLFTVDAPLAQDFGSDGSDEEIPDRGGDTSEDEDDVDNDDDEEEDEEESDDESSDSDSAPEFDGASANGDQDEQDGQGQYEEKGANAPRITIPEGVVDFSLEDEEKDVKGKGKAVWHDSADDRISVDMEKDNRMKKLARGKKGGLVDGQELQKRLRQQFETLHPRPEWANQRTQAGTPSLSTLLSSTKSFIDQPSSSAIIKGQKGKKRAGLKSGTIEMQRLRNANHQSPTTGKQEASNGGSGVVDIAWHPSERVGVLAVAGGDRRIRFFNVDGHTNPSLMTLHIPSLPLLKSTFHPTGSSILFTGPRPYYYTYDLASQRCLRSARNLFGSVPDATSPNSLATHKFSPDGQFLAVAGRRGAVSVLDWSNVGVGAVVADLRSGRGGAVMSLDWSHDGRELSVLGGRDGAEVEVWNIAERKVVRKWRDDRAFGGMVMNSSRGGDYTAIGSSTGIVNVYSASSLKSSQDPLDIRPDPLKSLEHLTTSITTLAFHPSSELLVTASKTRRDQLKLYHLPTLTAYQNFPVPNVPYKRISSMGFSANGEYLASGNQAGAVLLWRLKHYRQ